METEGVGEHEVSWKSGGCGGEWGYGTLELVEGFGTGDRSEKS